MKLKDIITVAISGVIVIGCILFAVNMFFPAGTTTSGGKSNTPTTDTSSEKQKITVDIDKDVLDKINNLKKYGDTKLDNIGRVNPFAPLN